MVLLGDQRKSYLLFFSRFLVRDIFDNQIENIDRSFKALTNCDMGCRQGREDDLFLEYQMLVHII